MTETEIERLVVRLTGDGSSYQRMTDQAQVGNQKMIASLERLEQAQKHVTKAQEETAKSTSALKIAFDYTFPRAAIAIDSTVASVTRLTTTFKVLKGEALETMKVLEASARGPLNSFSERTVKTYSLETYERGAAAGLAGYRRNLPSIARTVGYGDTQSATMITAREAEHQAAIEARRPEIERREREDREHTRSLGSTERGRISDPTERKAAIDKALEAATKEVVRLTIATESGDPNQMGTRSRYEMLDADWRKKRKSAIATWIKGGEDPHTREIAANKEALEKNVEKLKEAEQVQRQLTREAEAEAISRKRSLEDLMKAAFHKEKVSKMTPEERRRYEIEGAGGTQRDVREAETSYKASESNERKVAERESLIKDTETLTRALRAEAEAYGKIASEARIARMEKEKVDPKTIADYKNQVEMETSRDIDEEIKDIEEATSMIGMTPRQKRDKINENKMKKRKVSAYDIGAHQSAVKFHDKRQDEEDTIKDVEKLTKHLEEQAAALNKNRDPMEVYTKLIKEMNDEQKKAVKTASDKLVTAQAKAEGEEIRKSVRKPKEIMAEEQENLNKLLDKGGITLETYNRRLEELRKQLLGAAHAASQFAVVNASIAGSGEAIDKWMMTQEGALAGRREPSLTKGPDDVKGKPMSKSERRMAAAREKAVGQWRRRDPGASQGQGSGELPGVERDEQEAIAKRAIKKKADEQEAIAKRAIKKKAIAEMTIKKKAIEEMIIKKSIEEMGYDVRKAGPKSDWQKHAKLLDRIKDAQDNLTSGKPDAELERDFAKEVSNPSENPSDSMKDLLERIAKAVEAEAPVKVDTAGLK